MHQQPKKYPPLDASGRPIFAELKPEHRRDYLDGWGFATIGVPSARPTDANVIFFELGATEAREHAAKKAA
jgi:hypothetical protein